ncbi:unnamed protein product [Ambrosiozyma monospora]|uniref:Unnamed protein product n=1 Tax=Ambrosiozyma monospora TaxID=43982 RepID=A0ACB5T2V1_AMBMO|nr:unnamed protein product [Ambrosiozyma monospora]
MSTEPDISIQSDGLYDPENEELVNTTAAMTTNTSTNQASEQPNESKEANDDGKDEQKETDSDDDVIPLSDDSDSDDDEEDQKMENADSHDSKKEQDMNNEDDDGDENMDLATVEKLKALVQSDDEEAEKVEPKKTETQESTKPEEEEEGNEDDDVDYDPLSLLSDEKKKEVSDSQESNSSSISHEDVDVPLFNEVIKHVITTGMLNNPDFINLPPKQKEKAVLEEYNKANNTDVKVRLNFAATTSYNKSSKRNNNNNNNNSNNTNTDQYQIMIPINPFCLRPDLTARMSDEELASYRAYLKQEDSSLKSGKWDNYPIGSRLFVGNLPIGSMKKADLYRIFHPYGVVAQISLKQGFGFVQYETAEHCSRAIEGEKNVPLHGKFMHLEISKHQIQKAIEQKSGKERGN